ncbi:MAG TPA: CGNR zinc finger domain-containing protein [Streptosporangiaceae bacterium]|jgi:predicted RNA-binding Zn ribbon-like protein
MRVNHYNELLLRHVIDLVNTPPAGPDELATRWNTVCTPPATRVDATDLRTVRDYLARWTALIDAPTEDARVAHLNDLLARYATPPTVSAHDGEGWHMHYRPEHARHSAILTGATIVAAAQYLTAHGMHRLGRCALPECPNAYADFSRPGRQRYCSHTCANRDAVRRHRTRR